MRKAKLCPSLHLSVAEGPGSQVDELSLADNQYEESGTHDIYPAMCARNMSRMASSSHHFATSVLPIEVFEQSATDSFLDSESLGILPARSFQRRNATYTHILIAVYTFGLNAVSSEYDSDLHTNFQ